MTETPTPIKAELLERARELDVKGRSKMSAEELADAVTAAEAEAAPGAATAEPAGDAGEAPERDEPTLEELQAHARELEIEGRSSMSKPELADAIAKAEAFAAGHFPADTGHLGAGGAHHATTPGADTAAASIAGAFIDPDPTPDEIVGRPALTELATARAANRNPRVIGA